MKTDDNRCRECGVKLQGKNAMDVGYCIPCYNMMMAEPEDDEDMQENCPCCGREYDEIDYEYQICHRCKFNAEKQEFTERRS